MFIVRTMQQNIIFPFLGGVLNKQTHAKKINTSQLHLFNRIYLDFVILRRN